jgi:hypothetical protein
VIPVSDTVEESETGNKYVNEGYKIITTDSNNIY